MPKATAQAPPVPPDPANEPEKPIHTIRYGQARGQIWKADDNARTSYSLTIDRCVTGRAGTNQVSQIFLAEDVRHLVKVTTDAAKWIDWQQKRLAALSQSPR